MPVDAQRQSPGFTTDGTIYPRPLHGTCRTARDRSRVPPRAFGSGFYQCGMRQYQRVRIVFLFFFPK